MRALAFPCLALAILLTTSCGGDDGDSRHFGGNDASDDAATGGDIGFSDTADKDQAAPGDAAADAPDDSGPVGDTGPCADSCPGPAVRECVGAAGFRTCVLNGCLAWSQPESCGSDEVCQDGVCVFDGPDCTGLPTGCDSPGARRCSADAKAVEECNGAYECPAWDVLETCEPGKPCANGTCGGGVGPGACAELEACVDTACAEAVATGSNIKLMKCTLESCRTEYEGCLGGFGGGACKDLLKCAQSCPDAQCQKECTTTATYDANVQFVEVGVCLEDNCPGALEDPMGNIGCITGTCGTQLNACCGGSIMGCM